MPVRVEGNHVRGNEQKLEGHGVYCRGREKKGK